MWVVQGCRLIVCAVLKYNGGRKLEDVTAVCSTNLNFTLGKMGYTEPIFIVQKSICGAS